MSLYICPPFICLCKACNALSTKPGRFTAKTRLCEERLDLKALHVHKQVRIYLKNIYIYKKKEDINREEQLKTTPIQGKKTISDLKCTY